MHSRGLLAALLVGGAAVWLWPADAEACSCLAQAIGRSDPIDGAEDVAINRALVIQGYLDPTSITLEDANGEPVDVEINRGPTPGCPGTWAELVPRNVLDANATYVIRAETWLPVGGTELTRDSVTFKTGTSELPALTLTAPQGRVSVVENIPESGAACGSANVQACVGLSDANDVEIIARRGGEIIMRWMTPYKEGNYGFALVPDCLEFRRRGPTGQRSEPLIVCGEALGTRAFRASDMNGYEYLCRDGVTGVAEGGPTMGPPAAPADPMQGNAGARANTAGAIANAAGASADLPRGGAAAPEGQTPDESDSAQPKQRSYGCAAAPPAPASAWYVLVLVLAVQRLRRAVRSQRR